MKGFKELSLATLSLLACAVYAENTAPAESAPSAIPSEEAEPQLDKEPVKHSDVHVLTADTFDSFITEKPHVLTEFYAPWCGHCQALEPKYEEAATQLKGSHPDTIFLAKVNCVDHSALCEQQGVKGFPTLNAYKGKVNSSKAYSGVREAEAIVEFMKRQTQPVVTILDKDNHDEFSKAHKIVIVGYIDEEDKKSQEIFHEVADTLGDLYIFARTSHSHHAEGADVKFPSVVLYKQFDDPKHVYSHEELDVQKLTEFAKISSSPLVGEVGPETYTDYMESGLPLAYLFITDEEQKEKFKKMMKPLATKFKGKLNFATIDAVLYGAHAPNLNLKQEPWPAFAIQDTVKNYKYPYDQEKEITESSLTQFVEDFVSGKIKPTIKSEPIPEKQEGPVHVAVHNNWKDLVLDNDKDVIVKFYAPHCGHCKNLAPKYEKLAKLFFDHAEHSTKVTVAKFNCMDNDLPEGIDIQGFPTLKLFPAGAKESPVDYEGDRSVKDMANFVKDSGAHKINAYVAIDGEESEEEPEAEEDLLDQMGDMADDVEDTIEDTIEAAEGAAEHVTEKVKEAAEAASSAVSDDEDIHDEL